MRVYLLNCCAEVGGDFWGCGTVGGGASTVGVHQGHRASCRCGPSSSHSQSRGDRDIGGDLDLEWGLGTDQVASDEVHCLLGGDVCCWIDLCKAGQVGDLESDKYVRTILTDNLNMSVCACVRHMSDSTSNYYIVG